MINGAFGVGKTTVSYQLHESLPQSMLFDPEEIGFMLREMLPASIKKTESTTGDFQDFALWRQLTIDVAHRFKQQYHSTLIIPMTIRNPHYYSELRQGLCSVDEQLLNFCLTARKSTIEERLEKR